MAQSLDEPRIDDLQPPSRPEAADKPSPATAEQDTGRQTGRGKRTRKVFSRLFWLFLAAAVLGAAAYWWLNSRNFESTDDAQVEGHIGLISSRITGTVVSINPKVANNQFVEAGTLLVELDPRDYQADLDHAKANLATRAAELQGARVSIPIAGANAFGQLRAAEAAQLQAIASVRLAQANLLAAQHKLRQDEAIYARAERDRVRYLALVEKREISRSEYDARATDAAAAAQAAEADRANIAALEHQISEARGLVVQREAEVEAARIAPQVVTDAETKHASAGGYLEQARALVRSAELNLSYTKIYAPVSGVIGRKTVELGHRIQPGQSLMAIVPLDDIWITANFKETQMGLMKPGLPVTVSVDTFDRDYQGRIENMPGASGPQFSLFPPENATGNYVKVVQRFPVRIRLNRGEDPEHRLRPGMSVEATVKVR